MGLTSPAESQSSRAIEHPRAFFFVAGATLFAQLSYFLTASALPLYLRHSGAPIERVGLDVGAGSVAALVFAVLAGPLLNRKGVKTFLILGACLYIGAALLMLVSPFETAIIAARLMQGMALAIVGPAASAAVPLLAPKRVGLAVGIMTTVSTFPLAIGPAVGLTLYLDGGPSWLLVPTVAVALVGLGVGLAVRMPPVRTTETAAGLGFDRRWLGPLAANALNGVYFGALLAYLPIVLTRAHGPNAGIFFTADAVGVLLLRFPSGVLADRTRPTVPLLVGLALTLLGLLAFIPKTTIVWLVLAGMGTGVGAGLFATGLLTVMLGSSSHRNRGTAMSMSFGTASFGGFVGSAVSGLLFGATGFSGIIVFGFIAEAIGIPIVLLAIPSKPALVREETEERLDAV